MNHYYLIASLPALSLDAPAPITIDDFRSQCDAQLSAPDAALVAALLDGLPDSGGHPFMLAWQEQETRLRNAVARHRAAHQDIDPAPYLRPAAGFDTYTEKGVADAMARPDPLEREMVLDHLRWQRLDELTGVDPFAIQALLAYAIRLRLVLRWSALDEARGREQLEAATQGQLSFG